MYKVKRYLFKAVYFFGLSLFSGALSSAFRDPFPRLFLAGAIIAFLLTNETILAKMGLPRKPVLA